jgi:hypothetical protein
MNYLCRKPYSELNDGQRHVVGVQSASVLGEKVGNLGETMGELALPYRIYPASVALTPAACLMHTSF